MHQIFDGLGQSCLTNIKSIAPVLLRNSITVLTLSAQFSDVTVRNGKFLADSGKLHLVSR